MSESTILSQVENDVPLHAIRIDGGTQPRTEIHEATVAEYAEAMRQGVNLPPLILFFDGAEMWLADGFHRYHACQKLGLVATGAEIHSGTRRDAVLYAVGANATHGLPRTNVDKRRAVTMLLEDPEWVQWSDNAIARACHVSQPFVGNVRASLKTVISETPTARTYTTRHGTQATMRTAKVGKSKPAAAAKPSNSGELENPDSPANGIVAAPASENQDSPANLISDDPAPASATPAPEQGTAAASRVDQLVAENTQLRLELGELAEQFEDTLAEAETMRKIIEADAPLAEAMQQLKQALALNRVLETRLQGLISEKNEILRRYNGARHELDRLKASHA